MDNLRRGNHQANDADYDYVVGEPNDQFEVGLNSDPIFIIQVPDSRSLRVVSRSLFLAALLLALPSIASIIGAGAPSYDADADTSNNLPLILHHLMEDGLITKGLKGFVLGSGEFDFTLLRDAGVNMAGGTNLRRYRAGAHQVFDYIYAGSFSEIEVMYGVIRDGGLAIAPLGGDPSAELRLVRNFKVVYLRRLNGKTVVAMRKSAAGNYGGTGTGRQQVLCGNGVAPEKKESVLKGLEDVYLEAPNPRNRKAKKSGFRFLPDLTNDPLDGYGRRVFIADDSKAMDWFYSNYPMRGQEFQVYSEMDGNWIGKTGVRAEDYVVMKAGARLVEQMMRDKTLCVVDELFLECNCSREEDDEHGERQRNRKRAYWECVALYGKIRDEGIAVHQWWY